MENPMAELLAICDIRDSADLDLPQGIPFYTDATDMLLNTKGVDVVCVCTPNGLHIEHTMLALSFKCNVLCEKPFGLNVVECQKAITMAKEVGKEIFCVMQNRYSPPSKWLKQVVMDGNLGEIFIVQLNCYWNRDERYYQKGGWRGTKALDGGTLFTQFSHFIDSIYWVFGEIENISAKFYDFNHESLTEFEDSGHLTFDFKNGGKGIMSYSTSVWGKNFESSLTVIAENGSLKIAGQYMDKVQYCHVKNYTVPTLEPTAPANDYGLYTGSASNHLVLIQQLIDRLQGRKTEIATAESGYKVVEIIEKIYGSASHL